MMKAALISPYWDVLGGSEKYLLDIGNFLYQNHYQVEIFWPDKEIKARLIERFGPKFEFLTINSQWQKLSSWQKILNSRQYKTIFYHSDGSYFWSLAKKNFQLFQVPSHKLIPHHNWWNTFKFDRWTPIFNSQFTRRFFLKNNEPKKHHLLYPMIDSEAKTIGKKSKIILSVGRFFGHLHSKKQEVLIKAFINGCQKHPELKDYHLILIGALKPEDQQYFDYLQRLKGHNKQIEIKTNLNYDQVQAYYNKAQIYWHAAGYNIDEQKQPELVEHFGITIVEAMNHYCVPIVYQAGGPKETVLNDKTGYFFNEPKTLVNQTVKLIKQPPLLKQMALNAHARAITKFGQKAFNSNLYKIMQ